MILAKPEKLERLKAMNLIDRVISRYPAYNWDDVFFLELGFVYNILLFIKEKDEFSERYQQAYKKSLPKKP